MTGKSTETRQQSFTVKKCRVSIAKKALCVWIQTADGVQLRENMPFFEDVTRRAEALLKSCGVYREEITIGEIERELPLKQGRAIIGTDPGGAQFIENYLIEGTDNEGIRNQIY